MFITTTKTRNIREYIILTPLKFAVKFHHRTH